MPTSGVRMSFEPARRKKMQRCGCRPRRLSLILPADLSLREYDRERTRSSPSELGFYEHFMVRIAPARSEFGCVWKQDNICLMCG